MVHDIMVNGVPNLDDAAVKLREELDQFEDLFGEIQWVRTEDFIGPTTRLESRTQTSGSKLIRGPPKHIMCYKTPRVARQLAEVDRIHDELETQRQQY
ncbi:hypothetical protein BpHYR1_010715 [Brachionus plicatilis]|uniref:Uncharacterized protein n=1 Tax=Brachionus plicatilis TaxID=10195 RepID=A0A3M7RLY3_BRAPC|nr:hypothetical protein BpHYR1_010715 [Brachionus plicatilis]